MRRRTQTHLHKIRKPKIFYPNTNKLISSYYIVINKCTIICITFVKRYIDSEIGLKRLNEFPTNLGYHISSFELLNTINEIEFNAYIYKIVLDFDFTEETIPEDDTTPIFVNDKVIDTINEYIFTFGKMEIFDEEDGLEFLNELF